MFVRDHGVAQRYRVDVYVVPSPPPVCNNQNTDKLLTIFPDINNIGTVAATLEPFGSDPVKVAKLQASLVSLLSIFNSLGRLLSGFTSDHFAHHVAEAYRIERVWWLGESLVYRNAKSVALMFLSTCL